MEQNKNNKTTRINNRKKVTSTTEGECVSNKIDTNRSNVSKPENSRLEIPDIGNDEIMDVDEMLQLLIELQIEHISVIDTETMPESMLGLLKILIPLEISRLKKIQPDKMTYEEKMENIRELLRICKMDYPTRHKMIIVDHLINEKLTRDPPPLTLNLNDNIKSYVTTYIVPKAICSSKTADCEIKPVKVSLPDINDPNYTYESKYNLDLNLPDNLPEPIIDILTKSIETIIDEKMDEYDYGKSEQLEENHRTLNHNKDFDSHVNVDLRGSIINNINVVIENKTNTKLYLFGRDAISHIDRFVLSDALIKSNDSTIFYFLRSPPKYPEYYDIFIPELDSNYFFEYTGENWYIHPRDIMIDKVKRGDITSINKNIRKFLVELSNSEKTKFDEWIILQDTSPNINAIKHIFKRYL